MRGEGERSEKGVGEKRGVNIIGRIDSQRTFEARVGHVGHEKELAVHINALVRHENFGANGRVQEKDDDDRELDCPRSGRREREAAAWKLAHNASCFVREPLEHNARNGEDDEVENENADNDERLRERMKKVWRSGRGKQDRADEGNTIKYAPLPRTRRAT